jgi:hypothetical protein
LGTETWLTNFSKLSSPKSESENFQT